MNRNNMQKRLISIILALLLLLSMPLQVFSVSDVDETQESSAITGENQDPIELDIIPNDRYFSQGNVTEILSRREANVKHYLLPGGMVQALVFSEPIHARNGQGDWIPIDNKLTLTNIDGISIYTTSDARISFSQSIRSDKPVLVLSENGYSVSMSLLTPALPNQLDVDATVRTYEDSESTRIVWDSVDEAVAAALPQSTVRYSNVYPSTDLEYTLRGNGIKETIVVKAAQQEYSYRFKLDTLGLKPVLSESGAILLSDASTGELRFKIPAPYMYDSKGEMSLDVRYELVEVKNEVYILSVVADADWVNAENREYPVMIDPTILTVSNQISDTFVNVADPNTPYGDWGVWVDPAYTGFIRGMLPTLPTGTTLVGGTLNVHYHYLSSDIVGSRQIGVYLMNQEWSESTTTYNSLYSLYGASLGASTTALDTKTAGNSAYISATNPMPISFDVSSALQAWYSGTTPNYGVALKHVNGTLSSPSGANLGTIIISHDSLTDYSPYFSIIYRESELASGIYRIKNVYNNKYLDVSGGSISEDAKIAQWTLDTGVIGNPNRNQLFKITFLGSDSQTQLNYYSIRPMTNNGQGMYASYSAYGTGVTVRTMSTEEDITQIPQNQRWAITKNGSYYTLKNGPYDSHSYLSAPTNDTNGTQVITASSLSSKTQWVLEPYTGDSIDGVSGLSTLSSVLLDTPTAFQAVMYSSTVGRNGPVIYSVYEPDYTPTDKATITSSGVLTATETGQVRIAWTYAGSPWMWSRLLDIVFESGLVYTIEQGNQQFMLTASSDGINVSDGECSPASLWKLEYAGDGYYKIKSDVTERYLTSPANSTPGAIVTQAEYSMSCSLWKFKQISDDRYRLVSKYQYENSSSLFLGISSAGNLIQTNVASSAAWLLKPLTMNVVVRYDQAFVTRHTQELYRSEIMAIFSTPSSGGASIMGVLKERYGIKLKLTITDGVYDAYPTVKNCECENAIDTVCYNHYDAESAYNCQSLAGATANSDCIAGRHHKNSNMMLEQLPGVELEDSNQIDMLISGQKTCAHLNSVCTEGVAGWCGQPLSKVVIVHQEVSELWYRQAVFHELMHLFLTPDHGRTATPEEDNNQATPYDDCIYGTNQSCEDVQYGLLTCTMCDQLINTNKCKLYGHNN